MVCEIVRRVLDYTDSNRAELACIPGGRTCLPKILGLGYGRPVRHAKRDVLDILGGNVLQEFRNGSSTSGEVLVAGSLGSFVVQSPLQGINSAQVGRLSAITKMLNDFSAGFTVAVLCQLPFHFAFANGQSDRRDRID